MKTIKYRMNGKAWDVSRNENILRTWTRKEAKEIESLCTDVKTFLSLPYWMKAQNGTIFEEVEVGRTGWAHRGYDYYRVTRLGVEYQTRSFLSALRIFRMVAVK